MSEEENNPELEEEIKIIEPTESEKQFSKEEGGVVQKKEDKTSDDIPYDEGVNTYDDYQKLDEKEQKKYGL